MGLSQIRTRGEYRNGALSPRGEGDKPAGFINERARLTLGYERKKLSLKFSAQHVGVWGQDALVDKNGRFILNEAWAAFHLNDSWFMQLGSSRWCMMMSAFWEDWTGTWQGAIMMP